MRNQQNGQLNIVWTDAFALSCDKEEYTTFATENPTIQITTMEEKERTGIHFLKEGIVDVGYILAPVPDDLQSQAIVGREPLCAILDRNHPLAGKEEVELKELKNYQVLFPRNFEILKKNIIEKAKDILKEEKVTVAEVPYTQMLHAVYSSDLVGIGAVRIFRYIHFPEIVFLPIKYHGDYFYMIESHLVTAKKTVHRKEVHRYIDHVKNRYEGKFV